LPVDAACLPVYFKPPGLLQCSSVRITDTLLRKLQSVQNAAARLLTRTGRREHITPALRQLHWLPVSHQKISRGLAPTYLQDRCRLASEVSSGRRTSMKLRDRRFCSWTKIMEQSARASASIRNTHNFQETIKDIFVFRLGCST